MQASEMTIEQIEVILEGMNWTEIHKARVFSDYGDKVVLYTDGEFSIQNQSTYYRNPDEAGVISYLNCWGQGNVDRTDYFEGWIERNEDGEYIETETGRILTEDEAFTEAIDEGDWDYYEEIDAVIENIQQERRESIGP